LKQNGVMKQNAQVRQLSSLCVVVSDLAVSGCFEIPIGGVFESHQRSWWIVHMQPTEIAARP
jgi:hypothetical protein